MISNNKAQLGNQILIFQFIFLILLISIGLFAGISLFFSQEYNYKLQDASLLNSKIRSCLSSNNLSQNPDEFKQQLFSICSINQKVIEENFIVKIKLNSHTLYNHKADETVCSLSDKNPEFPRCISSSYMRYSILTGSNQNSKVLL